MILEAEDVLKDSTSVNKRTKILPLATSQIARLCIQFNHVFTANSMPGFNNNIFLSK